MSGPAVRRLVTADREEWRRMRVALWPDSAGDDLAFEMAEMLGDADSAVFVAVRGVARLGGFAEWSLRRYADGCATRPVGYLEGIWVDEDLRLRGVARALVAAGEAWARGRGCREVGSDCELANEASRRMHVALGFAEAGRLIHFAKRI